MHVGRISYDLAKAFDCINHPESSKYHEWYLCQPNKWFKANKLALNFDKTNYIKVTTNKIFPS